MQHLQRLSTNQIVLCSTSLIQKLPFNSTISFCNHPVMRRFFSSATPFNFIHQPTWKSHPHLFSSSTEVLPGVTKDHFKKRIDRLAVILPDNCAVIVPSYKTKYSSQNIFYPYKQNNNLFYLTGFNEPDSCLLITKKSKSSLEVNFFVTPNDPNTLLWSGPRAGIEGSREIFGLQNTFDIKKLPGIIDDLSKSNQSDLYVDYDSEHSSLSQDDWKKISASCKSIDPFIKSLRLLKTPGELELMKKSSEIASEAFKQTIAFSRNAENERELAAFMEFKSKCLGADGLAYVPVVAGASRGLVLHYTHNNQKLRPGKDWMLMDAGASYFGYCSDITRSWPLSGKFSDPQARLYDAVLRVQEKCQLALESIPKLSFNALNEIAAYLIAVELEYLGFKDVERNVHKWFPHSIGHHLGLDLHDCPNHNPNDHLVAGNVITIEPGIYVPIDDPNAPEEYRGIAIRIEDDFIIEGDGKITNMTKAVPKTISSIEQLLGGI